MTKTAVRSLRVENVANNQTIIHAEGNKLLQSYNSRVAIIYKDGKSVTLGRDWDYGITTMKYVGQFLNSNAKEIRENIKSGKWKYDEKLV